VIYAVTALDGLAYGLLLFVVAAGLTLIFGVMGVLNLAHGSFYLAGGYVAYLLCRGSLADFGVALLVGIIVGAGAGAALGAATRPLARFGPLLYPLATLGLALLAADAYTAATDGRPLLVDPPHALAGTITIGQFGYPYYRLVFIVLAALLGLALHVVVTRSRFGVQLRATVADPVMAAATGVNTRRVQSLAMAAGGALAVLGGVLGAPIIGPAPGIDNTVLVYSLIIVVIGGAGSIPGTLIGALLVGQVITLGVLISSESASFALFAVLLAVLTVRARSQMGAIRA
jgi:branched-subunit amino acid ABC-type transport system permease component